MIAPVRTVFSHVCPFDQRETTFLLSPVDGSMFECPRCHYQLSRTNGGLVVLQEPLVMDHFAVVLGAIVTIAALCNIIVLSYYIAKT